MKHEELYPELSVYIWNFCRRLTEDELAACRHKQAEDRLTHDNSIGFHKYHNQEQELSKDKNVLKLLENGYEHFKNSVVTRIWNEHKDELELNLCPKCNKIARTPWAEQCRFCLYSWREKNNEVPVSTSE